MSNSITPWADAHRAGTGVHLVEDGTYHFEGLWKVPSKCRRRIWLDLTNHKIIVMFTSLETDDDGTSITNATEMLCQAARKEHDGTPISSFVFVEHYPERGTKFHPIDEDYALVTFDSYGDRKFSGAHWKHISREDVQKMLGEASLE